MVAATSGTRSGDYERTTASSLQPLKQLTMEDASDSAPNKNRWSTFRAFNPFITTSLPPDSPDTPTAPSAPQLPTSKSLAASNSASSKTQLTNTSSSNSRSNPPSPPIALTPNHSFQFSLTHMSRTAMPPPRRLVPPNLPPPAQKYLQEQYPTPPATRPHPPSPALLPAARYAGRALAEWNLLVDEARCFIERRLSEGVLDWAGVEVPTLGVETVRRPLG